MSQKDEGRVPALKFALFLILTSALVGAALIVFEQFGAGALLLSTACLSMTILARP